MPLLPVVPLNQTQKITELQIIDDILVQPHTWYTCPAGKKARVKGWCFCESGGAAVTMDLVAVQSIAEWQASGGNANQNEPQNLALLVRFDFDVILNAGEILQTTQNTGTNAEFHIVAEAHETPA